MKWLYFGDSSTWATAEYFGAVPQYQRLKTVEKTRPGTDGATNIILGRRPKNFSGNARIILPYRTDVRYELEKWEWLEGRVKQLRVEGAGGWETLENTKCNSVEPQGDIRFHPNSTRGPGWMLRLRLDFRQMVDL